MQAVRGGSFESRGAGGALDAAHDVRLKRAVKASEYSDEVGFRIVVRGK